MDNMPFIQTDFDLELPSQKMDGFEDLQRLLDYKNDTQNEIAVLFADALKENAEKYLYTTKDSYINSIIIEDGLVTLDMSDPVVNMVEEGRASFDMKPGHLAGPKAKVGADGKKYSVVPISKYKRGRYNWRDLKTGKFSIGSNPGGDVEFRIISENSEPDSWIHPGHEGFHLIHNTLEEFDDILDQYLEEKLNDI